MRPGGARGTGGALGTGPRGTRTGSPGGLRPREGGRRGYGGDRPNVGPRDSFGRGRRFNRHYGYRFGFGYGFSRSCYSPWGFWYDGYRPYFSCWWGYRGYHWASWWWPAYFSCWYPIWSFGSRNQTVVVVEDNEPEVIYVQEPAGEAYVGDAVGTVLPPEPAVQPDGTLPGQVPESYDIASQRYLELGDAAFRDRRYSDAVQFYAKAVSFAPQEAALHLVLADALFATGDHHYAAFSIRRAFELDPNLARTSVDKHEFYADPAEFDVQLAQLETRHAAEPYNADLRLVLATNYLFGRRPSAAVDLLEAASPGAGASGLDTAAALVLEAARAVQYGPTSETPAVK